jgi:hypothetical protein
MRAKLHDSLWRNANTLTDYCDLQYGEMHTQKYFSSVKLESALYFVRVDNWRTKPAHWIHHCSEMLMQLITHAIGKHFTVALCINAKWSLVGSTINVWHLSSWGDVMMYTRILYVVTAPLLSDTIFCCTALSHNAMSKWVRHTFFLGGGGGGGGEGNLRGSHKNKHCLKFF